MIYDSILETIGNMPVVRLNEIAPKHVQMYVKVESFNPMGSVEDRLALAIISDEEAKSMALRLAQREGIFVELSAGTDTLAA